MPVGAFTFTKFAATGSALHAYTQSWVDRVTTAGGTVSTARQTVVDTFVRGLLTDGLLNEPLTNDSLINYFLLFASDGFTGCNVPLIDVLGVGNATLINFISGDYSSAGLTGNGSSKFVNTNHIAASYLSFDTPTFLSGGCLGQYSSAGIISTSTYGAYGSQVNAGSRFLQYWSNQAPGDHGFQLFTDANYTYAGFPYAHGLQLGNRPPSSNTARELRDGALLISRASTGIPYPPNIPSYFFARNVGGTAADFYPFTLRFGFFGKGLIEAQEGSFNSRCQTLVSSL